MGGELNQRGKSKARNNKANKKYYTSAKSREEVQEILEDVGYGNKQIKYTQRAALEASETGHGTVRRTPLPEPENSYAWSPGSYSAFKLLISAKFAAALWTTISDCDETYNYWEPTHYLLYGKGFQTWEYSPIYALRSYTYLLLHTLPAKLYDLIFKPNPLIVFFFVRCFLALISALAEVMLFRAIRRFVGTGISCIGLITSLFSAGSFISSTAYLPSSFSSYMTALAFGAWIEGLHELAIFAVALSSLLSWPFAALTGLFIAVDILLVQRKIALFFSWCMISLATILIPIIGIDSYYYGKLVVAPLNIVKYNIFSPKGPDLYGVEPWWYYISNGFLNFNITFIMALLAPILLGLAVTTNPFNTRKDKWLIVGTFVLWLGVFTLQPHKEERFLFPIYPLIPYCSAISLESLEILFARIVQYFARKRRSFGRFLDKFNYGQFTASLVVIWIVFTSVISGSRIIALHYGYRAPFDIYFTLHRENVFDKVGNENAELEFNLCYGKEWYRFPTSFFLPSSRWNTRFIQSEFKGQLPSLFAEGDPYGTRNVPDHMNDLNTEEMSRYISDEECDFLVDSATTNSLLEPNYTANTKDWTILSEQDFLNSQKSHSFFRAFYIPILSSQYTHYDKYVLLERKRKKRKQTKRFSIGKEFIEDNLDDDL